MDYSNIILVIVSLTNLILGLLILFRDKKNKINIFFSITTFGIFLWSLFIIFFNFGDEENIHLWTQAVYFSVNFTITFFLYFTFYFPTGSFPKNITAKTLLFGSPILVFLISLIPGSIISNIDIDQNRIYVSFGLGYYIHSFFTLIFFCWAYVNLIKKYRSLSGVRRGQILYLILGTVISTVIAILTNVVLFYYTTRYNWLGPTGTVIMVGFMAYAITRYRLMDIRAILFRTITFGFILLLITSVFAVTATIIASLFAEITDVQSNILAGLIISVLVTTLYLPARNLLEKLTNSVLYKRAYDSDVLLSKMNEVTSSILDFKKLLQTISDLLQDAFNSDKIGVALLNERNKLRVSYQRGFLPGVPEMLVTFPGVTRIMFKQFQETPGIFVVDERKTQFENGEFRPVSPKMLNLLDSKDLALIVPLYSKENLIGVLTLGDKKSGDPYSTRDINILTIMSGQIAVAVDRARLYAHLEELVEERTEELHEANTKLESANVQLKKLDAAKSEFISIASHQLRSPLTAIKGYISMMQEGDFGKVPQNLVRYLDIVFNSNERLIALVNDLLNISRIESGRQKYDFRLNDIVRIAEGIIMDIKPKADEKKLALILDKPKEPLPQVVCDGEKIHEVMMNFIDNAIKYTKAGNVHVSFKKESGRIIFSVKDTGMGIMKENMSLLFKKFSRGEGSFLVHTEGTGLGLYVAKMIVEIHEGKAWAESEGEGKGSTFSFSIPVNGPKKRPQETPDEKG